MTKEPTVLIGGLAEIVRAIIPMLLIFSVVHWTDAQTGSIIFFVGVIVAFAEKLFVRSQVVPAEVANSQIATAVRMPTDSTVEQVIAKNERENN